MNEIETVSENVVAFVVTSEKKCLNLDFLPRLPGIPKAELWLADSGSSLSMTNSQFGMTDFRPVSNCVVRSASGSRMRVTGIGNLALLFYSNGKTTPVHLKNVLMVPIARRIYFRCPLGKRKVTISLARMEKFECLTEIWFSSLGMVYTFRALTARVVDSVVCVRRMFPVLAVLTKR